MENESELRRTASREGLRVENEVLKGMVEKERERARVEKGCE